MKNAYKAYKKTPVSTADHNVVHLIPAYRTNLQKEGIAKKLAKKLDDNVAGPRLYRAVSTALTGAASRKPLLWLLTTSRFVRI
ncbi:hypothetical protein AN642_00150 [Epulopiscium sp. SCG-B10WGA-EpuloA2]|nr:hypothetical protein AN642_00150 [Epulopiscium sp. SCG-B10WGA-EpuloA2]